MRVNESIVALNIKNMLSKNKFENDSLKQQKVSGLKIVKNEESAVELVISEKMRAQIRELNNAEGNSRVGNATLNEAINTVQDITGILGEIQEVLQDIQKNNFESDSLYGKFKELKSDFVNVSNKEIFNSDWFENGFRENQVINSNSKIEDIKKLMNTYQNKLDELKELSKKLDTGQITESNLGAAESHVQDIATAEEFVNRTKKSIISEAKVAMLSQANKKPEQVINLLE